MTIEPLVTHVPSTLADIGDWGGAIFFALMILSSLFGAVFKSKEDKKKSAGAAKPGSGGSETADRANVQARLRELAERRRAELQKRAAGRKATGAGAAAAGAAPAASKGPTPDELRHRRRQEVERREAQRRERELAAQRQREQQRERRAAERRQRQVGTPHETPTATPAPVVPVTATARPKAAPPPLKKRRTQPVRLDERHIEVLDSRIGQSTAGHGPTDAGVDRSSILGQLDRDALRRAIIMKELLDPPLALRDPFAPRAYD